MSELEDDLIEQLERGLLRRRGIDIEADPVKYKKESTEQRKMELEAAFAVERALTELRQKRDTK